MCLQRRENGTPGSTGDRSILARGQWYESADGRAVNFVYSKTFRCLNAQMRLTVRHRIRFAAANVVMLVVAGLLLVPSAPAQAAASDAVVTDGNARFAVLTPSLVRLEYAGDRAFVDAATFNAVNRAFAPPAYTTTVTSDGYREIRTSALTLRYKQNSGPFTAANLSVTIGSTGATARPVFPSYCPVSVACEAEDALFPGNATPAYDHKGYTGTGFASGFEGTGSAVQYDVDVPAAGTWRLAVRYANAVGSDNQSATRTLTAHVNGATGPRFSLAPPASWDTRSPASCATRTVLLPARSTRTATSSGTDRTTSRR